MCISRARPTTRDCFTQAWLQDSYLMKLRRQTLTFTSGRLKEFLVEQQCRRTEDATKHKVLLRTYQSSPQSPASGTAPHVPSPKWDDGENAAPHMSLQSWICPQRSKMTSSCILTPLWTTAAWKMSACLVRRRSKHRGWADSWISLKYPKKRQEPTCYFGRLQHSTLMGFWDETKTREETEREADRREAFIELMKFRTSHKLLIHWKDTGCSLVFLWLIAQFLSHIVNSEIAH